MLNLLLVAAMAAGPLDIRDFGAVGDGNTTCTAAIQKAMDQAAATGGGVVVVPGGRFLSGTLRLRSHVELRLAPGAVLLGSPRRHDYDHRVMYSLILADNADDIAITGSGTIDGQGAAIAEDVLRMVRSGELKIPPKGWRPSERDRTEIIEFTNCHKVRIADVTIKNACAWVQTYRKCAGLSITGIKVDSKTYWNNDGIDVVDCKGAYIANCDVDADDDGICLKSEDPKSGCENILIENCQIRSSASAIKFGTTSYGAFRNIKIHGIRVRDTFRSAVAIESVDGADIENIDVENVTATHTGNPFFIRLGHRNLKGKPGRIQHVILKNFDVQVPSGRPDEGYPFHGPYFLEPHNMNPSSIVGHTEVPIEDVLLENIKVRMAGGGTTAVAHVSLNKLDKVPERAEFYPEFSMFGELPSWVLYVRHVRGLRIKNFTATLDQPDYRPAFVVDDTRALKAQGIDVRGSDRKPVMAVHKSAGIDAGWGIRLIRVP